MLDSWSTLSRVIARSLVVPASGSPELRRELGHLNDALLSAVCRNKYRNPSPHDYESIVRAGIAEGTARGVAPVAEAMAAVLAELPWTYSYKPRHGEPDLANRIAFAELIGPDGAMQAPVVRVGFTVMAPHTLYPMHAHPAVELYWVIAGTARWATPSRDARVPPGDFVLHRCNEPHAMQTFKQPLLALWGWSGDLDSPATYL